MITVDEEQSGRKGPLAAEKRFKSDEIVKDLYKEKQ
jgi:hypothetical protein